MRALSFAGFIVALAAIVMAQEQPRETRVPSPARVVSAALAGEAGLVAGVCEDHRLRIWDAGSGRLRQTIQLGRQAIDVLAISPPPPPPPP
ncbi:MAG: hypothetical protein JO041_12725, partial [Acidobacteria bacterium]|nr:hypothetical protein [Acidobacteriota bacterium]